MDFTAENDAGSGVSLVTLNLCKKSTPGAQFGFCHSRIERIHRIIARRNLKNDDGKNVEDL
jgi:hypothetical protein